MLIQNNTKDLNFKRLHIINTNHWDKERLEEFTQNPKIKKFTSILDKQDINVIAKPYNYVDSGNKPENFGVILSLKLKKTVKPNYPLSEIVYKIYHCSVPTMLKGFNVKKAIQLAKEDINYLKKLK